MLRSSQGEVGAGEVRGACAELPEAEDVQRWGPPLAGVGRRLLGRVGKGPELGLRAEPPGAACILADFHHNPHPLPPALPCPAVFSPPSPFALSTQEAYCRPGRGNSWKSCSRPSCGGPGSSGYSSRWLAAWQPMRPEGAGGQGLPSASWRS